MLTSLILYFGIALTHCPAIKKEGLPWKPEDDKIAETAKKRCVELYPKSPCVKRIIKKAETNFHVVCGAADGEAE